MDVLGDFTHIKTHSYTDGEITSNTSSTIDVKETLLLMKLVVHIIVGHILEETRIILDVIPSIVF